MQSEILHSRRSVPPLVYIVLAQATRRWTENDITDAIFDEQIRRITREELVPKGLILLVRKLPLGHTQFIIKEKATGVVCDTKNFDANGDLVPHSSDLLEAVSV